MSRWLLRIATGSVLLFLYLPIVTIVLYAFNGSRGQTWPITEWTTQWFGAAIGNPDLHAALVLILGTLAALVVHRFRFFGRETISYVVVLPIALPGIVTGMALNATFNSFHVPLTIWTIVIGHATFCVVTVYNNAIARMRRSSRSIEEASADLGATTWQTFRYVTLPVLRTALVAGGLLAFALSFDEVIVTTFTAGTQETIPLWIYNNLKLPNQRAIVNVVAVFLILLSLVPVYLTQRLASDGTGTAGRT